MFQLNMDFLSDGEDLLDKNLLVLPGAFDEVSCRTCRVEFFLTCQSFYQPDLDRRFFPLCDGPQSGPSLLSRRPHIPHRFSAVLTFRSTPCSWQKLLTRALELCDPSETRESQNEFCIST